MTHVDSFTNPEYATSGARYGVRVTGLGEDADRWVAFTHDLRRAIAAVSAEFRFDWGDRAGKVEVEQAGWWRLRDNCGCGDVCRHDKDEADCLDDDDCEWSLPPCGDMYGWMGETVEPGAEHAFPVIVFKVVGR